MKRTACLLLLTVLPAMAIADCVLPPSPTRIPTGANATRDAMVNAKRVVDKFQEDMTAFLACIKTEHEEQLAKEGSDMSDAQKRRFVQRYEQRNDAAVDEATNVAAKFNEELRAFRAANP